MSDDKNRAEELDRLRRDLEVLKRYDDRPGKYILRAIEKVEGEIRRIEQEQVDPWQEAKAIVSEWKKGESSHSFKGIVVNYVRHLEAENVAKSAKIVVLENDLKGEKLAGDIIRDDLKARISELESRPVQPLDPRRVVKTADCIVRCSGFAIYGWVNVEPYPLADTESDK